MGSHYDLAIALALLAAKGSIPASGLRSCAVFGGLALDGRVRTVPGILPAVVAALEAGLERVIVPALNIAEARLVQGVEIIAVKSLRECMAILAGEEPPDEPDLPPLHGEVPGDTVQPSRIEDADLLDVRGQVMARWCVEVAAAGGHHLFFEGPPGAGKTMLAERFPALLPDLSVAQSIEVSKIHSVAGLLSLEEPLVTRPPFLAPNHTDTVPSVVGGGSRVIRPGAISLAHLGVLFMDEAPEFAPSVHDALRQPLESREISIRRADGAAKFPAGFQLILAANPCPCGLAYGHADKCTCTPPKKRLYKARISGPIRDRIDIVHTVLPVSRAEMHQQVGADGSTAAVSQRVVEARHRQRRRFRDSPWVTNADLPGYEFRRRCPLDAESALLVEDAVAAGTLTQRGADRVTRVAWTIADLGGLHRPDASHVMGALFLRSDSQAGEPPPARERVSWGA